MKITFNIHYNTHFGQQIFLCGSGTELGNWSQAQALPMTYHDGGLWRLDFVSSKKSKNISYKYLLKNNGKTAFWEWGKRRVVKTKLRDKIAIFDSWRNPTKQGQIFYTAPFYKSIFKPPNAKKSTTTHKRNNLHFSINLPRIGSNYRVCVIGSNRALGLWQKAKGLFLECGENFPKWEGSIFMKKTDFPFEYKYAIYDSKKREIATIEERKNRVFNPPPSIAKDQLIIICDESFAYPVGNWKAAGVSVPVFSLRTDKSFGVGEFLDIIPFAKWAKSVSLKMIQILPINDTISSGTWLDSYPYKTISVMALHPMYVNLEKTGILADKSKKARFEKKQKRLNELEEINYPQVVKIKMDYFRAIFNQKKHLFFKQKSFLDFYQKNRSWLVSYGVFCYLRELFGTTDFSRWGEFAKFDSALCGKLLKSKAKDKIRLHFFIQYHAYRQLGEAAKNVRDIGLSLKGDIPIGVSPHSVETWTKTHLFNLNQQAGAPPDDFSTKGQNWGFPTYNWNKMAKNGYKWWQERLTKMADYFDVFRIDHILGFFRIWEIPIEHVQGVLGHFKPALPLSAEEIEGFGIGFDFERFVKPYISDSILHTYFGEFTKEVKQEFLDDADWGKYRLKPHFGTQRKVEQYFALEGKNIPSDKRERIKSGLFDLISNVLFLQTGYNSWQPRISAQKTTSFSELDEGTKNNFNRLYNHFFYHRHNDFWFGEAMKILPTIVNSTDMLVCGEDLGMVPDCVGPVMQNLNILSLEIQRMSKNPHKRFAHPADAPYLCVCTTSTHDMPTIRLWWEQDREQIQRFYNDELGIDGGAPYFAEPWVCERIITQHLFSPAMWTTFPIQDLLALDADLRWSKTAKEYINDPSNSKNKWNYRMRQSVSQLQKAVDFNNLLKKLIRESGRDSHY